MVFGTEDIAQNILLTCSVIQCVVVYLGKKKTPRKVRVEIEVFSYIKVYRYWARYNWFRIFAHGRKIGRRCISAG